MDETDMESTEIRGLTVLQPWAWAIAELEKDIENRTWYTAYRGLVAIHAGSVFRRRDYEFARAWLSKHIGVEPPQPADLTRGAILCVVRLTNVIRTNDTQLLLPWEMENGYGWQLAEHRRLPQPVPCRGSQLLWRIPQNLVHQIAA